MIKISSTRDFRTALRVAGRTAVWLARSLGVSRSTLYYWARTGHWPESRLRKATELLNLEEAKKEEKDKSQS